MIDVWAGRERAEVRRDSSPQQGTQSLVYAVLGAPNMYTPLEGRPPRALPVVERRAARTGFISR